MKAIWKFVLALIIIGVVSHPTYVAIIWPKEVAQVVGLEPNIAFWTIVAGLQLIFIVIALAIRESKLKYENKAH